MAEDGSEVRLEEGSESKQPKCRLKPQYHRLRIKPTNWTAVGGGSGMQAIFLDSGQRPCGTGVFLPRRAGTEFHPTKKPALSPVLLPSRVVQALNLNVHELGLQIKQPRGTSNDSDCIHHKFKSNRKGNKDVYSHCCVNASPEIFLPKEWTY